MDDTIALIRKSHDGDKKAREELVEKNIGLISVSYTHLTLPTT